jgi:hypothetical protein
MSLSSSSGQGPALRSSLVVSSRLMSVNSSPTRDWPGVPRKQRPAEPGISLQQGQDQVERPLRERGVLPDRHQLGAADPYQARGLRPLHDPVEMSEILAGSCREDPAADFRVDPVAGTEQLHEMAGIRQADAPGLGELASRTDPCQE